MVSLSAVLLHALARASSVLYQKPIARPTDRPTDHRILGRLGQKSVIFWGHPPDIRPTDHRILVGFWTKKCHFLGSRSRYLDRPDVSFQILDRPDVIFQVVDHPDVIFQILNRPDERDIKIARSVAKLNQATDRPTIVS